MIPAVQAAMDGLYPNGRSDDNLHCDPDNPPYPSLNEMINATHDWAVWLDGRNIQLLVSIVDGAPGGMWGDVAAAERQVANGDSILLDWMVAEYGHVELVGFGSEFKYVDQFRGDPPAGSLIDRIDQAVPDVDTRVRVVITGGIGAWIVDVSRA